MENAVFEKNFIILEKKYYLVNTGYHNMSYFLCFYNAIKCYLKEQAMADPRFANNEKLFNFCYFSFKIVIKRIFDVIKY